MAKQPRFANALHRETAVDGAEQRQYQPSGADDVACSLVTDYDVSRAGIEFIDFETGRSTFVLILYTVDLMAKSISFSDKFGPIGHFDRQFSSDNGNRISLCAHCSAVPP